MPPAPTTEDVLFRLLADASVEFIGMCDAAFTPFYVNPAGQRLVGLPSMEAACAAKVQDFFFPEDQPFITDEFFPRVLSEGAGEVEIRFRHFVTGEAIWMLYNVFTLRDAAGQAVGYATVSRDIHRRKLAEDALREREALMALFIEHAPASIAMFDRDMRYLAVSSRWQSAPAYAGRELLGQTIYEALPDMPARWRDIHQRCLDGAVETSEEDRFERVDGSTLWLRWDVRPWYRADGAIGGLVISAEDITARQLAEQAVRERERQLALFIEQAPVSIAMFDRDMRYLAASRGWLAEYGLGDRELRGQSHYEVFPDIPERWREIHRRCLAGATERAEEDRFERDDGSVQWLRWEIRPWRDARGAIGGIVIFSEDISARKNAEDLHERLQDELRQAQKLESLGVMAGGIAHQYNNLLTAVLGNCELAELQLPHASPPRGYIHDAMEAARRASDLTAQLLAYAGKGQFVVEDVDLSRLIEEMRSRVAVSVPATCAVRYQLARELPLVVADGTQMRQVVMNLVLNAAEAIGSAPGQISIRTGSTERDSAVVPDEFGQRHLPAGTYVFAEVADTGCGISEEHRARLFDPFFTTKFTGRGLGLPAVFGIVRAHHGVVEVESAVGEGTSVRFLLPASTRGERVRER